MKVLRRIDATLFRAEGALVVLLLSLMILLSFVQVILRNAFAETLLWGEILLRHLVLWIGFIGAAMAASADRHIHIDALTRFLPPRLKLSAKILTNLFAATVCFFLLRASLTFVGNEIEDGSVLYSGIPSWYSQIIIPGGFGLIIVHVLIRTAVHLETFFGKDVAS